MDNIMSRFGELNSATKYPSIETYHVMVGKGRLSEELGPFEGVAPDDQVWLTEKINGTNGRIVLLPGKDYFIGQREELIHARGDRVLNLAHGIVPELLPVAERLVENYPVTAIEVFFFEVYGGKITGASKQYSRTGGTGHRLFDHAVIGTAILDWNREDISRWRESGGQSFHEVKDMQAIAYENGLPLVPYLTVHQAKELPQDVDGSYEYLKHWMAASQAGLDTEADWTGFPEGLVLRTGDRSRIAKMRYEDVHKTLGLQHPKGA